MSLILASASPRRQELLRLITEDFLVHNSNIDESLVPGLSPADAVLFTGVCLALPAPGMENAFVSRAQVTFAPLGEDEILSYVASGEPADKAGAYGIQGLGARFIERINGDYYTVMGLPVCGLYHLMREQGLL